MAERDERATGTPNTIYNLASVLYHTLDAGTSYDQYLRDAEEAGDQELVVFFRVLRDEDSRRADYAQELLARRTSTGARMADTATPGDRRMSEEMAAGGSQRTASAGPAPGAGDIPPPSMEEQEAQPTQAGTEGAVPPRRDEEAPSTERGVRARPLQREQEEDRGLLDQVRDRLLGPQEAQGRERTDRPGRR
jgi:hypothetical protein